MLSFYDHVWWKRFDLSWFCRDFCGIAKWEGYDDLAGALLDLAICNSAKFHCDIVLSQRIVFDSSGMDMGLERCSRWIIDGFSNRTQRRGLVWGSTPC